MCSIFYFARRSASNSAPCWTAACPRNLRSDDSAFNLADACCAADVDSFCTLVVCRGALVDLRLIAATAGCAGAALALFSFCGLKPNQTIGRHSRPRGIDEVASVLLHVPARCARCVRRLCLSRTWRSVRRWNVRRSRGIRWRHRVHLRRRRLDTSKRRISTNAPRRAPADHSLARSTYANIRRELLPRERLELRRRSVGEGGRCVRFPGEHCEHGATMSANQSIKDTTGVRVLYRIACSHSTRSSSDFTLLPIPPVTSPRNVASFHLRHIHWLTERRLLRNAEPQRQWRFERAQTASLTLRRRRCHAWHATIL